MAFSRALIRARISSQSLTATIFFNHRGHATTMALHHLELIELLLTSCIYPVKNYPPHQMGRQDPGAPSIYSRPL